MNIMQATSNQAKLVSQITQETIKAIYPHYYAPGAVRFFSLHHHEDSIKEDIASGSVYLILNASQKEIGTVTCKGNEICRLFVLPDHQAQGYGTRLLEFAEALIAKQYDTITLAASLPAKHMYEKHGYQTVASHVIETEELEYLCYDVMQKNITSSSECFYEGKTFTVKTNTDNGEVRDQTQFHYHQKGDVVWAEYEGGDVIKGFLVGLVHTDGSLRFSYQHVNDHKQMRIGTCNSTPVRLQDGTLELHEQWQWLNGDQSYGTSILIEMTSNTK